MIVDIVRTDNFKYVFSMLLGIGTVIVIFRPYCKGDDCSIWKAPPIKEVSDGAFKVGEKCYKFTENGMDCPKEGNIIEAFRGEFTCRPTPYARKFMW